MSNHAEILADFAEGDEIAESQETSGLGLVRYRFNKQSGVFEQRLTTARFVAGSIPFDWMRKANRISGKAAQVAIALCFLRGVKQSKTFKVTAESLDLAGCSRQAYYRALNCLEAAELIEVVRMPGNRAQVTLRDFR